jgi:hypothetical protein
VLRTGLSPGADQAFYRGALAASGAVELYLPHPDFEREARSARDERSVTVLDSPGRTAESLAADFHPHWDVLDEHERLLRARDCHEILGADLGSPSELVICWTPDGGIDGSHPSSGGAGQALRIAHTLAIPTLNLAQPRDVLRAGG